MQVFKCNDIEWIKNLLNRSSNNRQLTEMEYRHFGMLCERAGAMYLFITDQIQFYQFLNKAFNPFSVDAPENMEIPVKDISRYSTVLKNLLKTKQNSILRFFFLFQRPPLKSCLFCNL